MRKRVSGRLRKIRKLVGEAPEGFLEDVRDLDIRHETCGNVYTEATEKTTRRTRRKT